MTIDDRLSALAASDVHPDLGDIDAGVFARVSTRIAARRQARHMMLAVTGAASIAGLASAALPTPAPARADFVPMGLAPSTLLGGE